MMEIPRQFYFIAVRGSEGAEEFRIQDEPKSIYAVFDSIAPEGDPNLHIDRDLPIIGGIRGVDALLQSGFDVDNDGNTFPIDWTSVSQWFRFRPSVQRSMEGRWNYVGEQWLPKPPRQKTNAPYENLGLEGFMKYINGLDF